jgi:peptide/nickel transport system substrate-binding protein/microcin C transport system substrate-binding protein
MHGSSEAQKVNAIVNDSLITRNIDSWEWEPRLAEKWEISKDGKVFTFFLRKDATFHDGKPVTAEDVKFSFDAIFEPKYKAANLIPYYENFEKIEIVDTHTLKFHVKQVYFQNFETAAGMYIIPKHIYSNVEKSVKLTKELIGAGPYKLEKFEKGQRLVLKKYKEWYGYKLPQYANSYNFETIIGRYVMDPTVFSEMISKGDMDLVDNLTAEQFMQKLEGGNWGKTAFKVKAENKRPKPYRYIGWNLQNEIFKDKGVRIALAHLMNREEMNKKFRFSMSLLAAGPAYPLSENADPDIKPIAYDTKKAADLFAKAGWKDSDKDGVLDRQIKGKKTDFRFTIIYPNKEYERYLVMYKEELKSAGIVMDMKFIEWNSFLKTLDEGKFDAANLAWTTSVNWDGKQIWHSTSAVPGGSNFIHYKNPEVDKLIDKARAELDEKKRTSINRKIYRMIAEDAPYLWMFTERFDFYGHSNKVEKPAETFQYDYGSEYWWAKSP